MFIFFSLSFPRGKEEKRSKRERKAKEKQNNKKHVSMCYPKSRSKGAAFCVELFYSKNTNSASPRGRIWIAYLCLFKYLFYVILWHFLLKKVRLFCFFFLRKKNITL